MFIAFSTSQRRSESSGWTMRTFIKHNKVWPKVSLGTAVTLGLVAGGVYGCNSNSASKDTTGGQSDPIACNYIVDPTGVPGADESFTTFESALVQLQRDLSPTPNIPLQEANGFRSRAASVSSNTSHKVSHSAQSAPVICIRGQVVVTASEPITFALPLVVRGDEPRATASLLFNSPDGGLRVTQGASLILTNLTLSAAESGARWRGVEAVDAFVGLFDTRIMSATVGVDTRANEASNLTHVDLNQVDATSGPEIGSVLLAKRVYFDDNDIAIRAANTKIMLADNDFVRSAQSALEIKRSELQAIGNMFQAAEPTVIIKTGTDAPSVLVNITDKSVASLSNNIFNDNANGEPQSWVAVNISSAKAAIKNNTFAHNVSGVRFTDDSDTPVLVLSKNVFVDNAPGAALVFTVKHGSALLPLDSNLFYENKFGSTSDATACHVLWRADPSEDLKCSDDTLAESASLIDVNPELHRISFRGAADNRAYGAFGGDYPYDGGTTLLDVAKDALSNAGDALSDTIKSWLDDIRNLDPRWAASVAIVSGAAVLAWLNTAGSPCASH